jgi:hypothetical protein
LPFPEGLAVEDNAGGADSELSPFRALLARLDRSDDGRERFERDLKHLVASTSTAAQTFADRIGEGHVLLVREMTPAMRDLLDAAREVTTLLEEQMESAREAEGRLAGAFADALRVPRRRMILAFTVALTLGVVATLVFEFAVLWVVLRGS